MNGRAPDVLSDVSPIAARIRVEGAVQGVGFRPFVSRLARAHGLTGWVLNTERGVELHLEGPAPALVAFEGELRQSSPAPSIRSFAVASTRPLGCTSFQIRASRAAASPTLPAPVDVAACDACIGELLAPAERRHLYPYVSCATCGPRYSILLRFPYDRTRTTMAQWPLCAACAEEYANSTDRRFHAQPIACPTCGPRHRLVRAGRTTAIDSEAFVEAARALTSGAIVAVKSLGGYHLACDARNASAVAKLRARKRRAEKPFAVMANDLDTARSIVDLDPREVELLTSPARPIVLARARVELEGVATETLDLGVMLPYTPAQHLLFLVGAPTVLVMTSANRSDEPLTYEDADALERLADIADVFLVGERPIARRLDDSVAHVGPLGPTVLRRGRGYAPASVAAIPDGPAVLAVGADLKSTITLAVSGQAFMSQHLGDLEHVEAQDAFREAITDMLSMYEIDESELTVVHDLHPQYVSTRTALAMSARTRLGVQHHRAHVASVLAERAAYDDAIVGIACDGTGYGEDGGIWGGELFAGSLGGGLARVGHLRQAVLVGGDAAARHPVQAAAGFLAQLDELPDLGAPPFRFPARYEEARALLNAGVRTWPTTSVGRLFDTAAALCGFTRPVTYEGQAAAWLEQLARRAPRHEPPESMQHRNGEVDFRETLRRLVEARSRDDDPRVIARCFHAALAAGLAGAATELCESHDARVVVLSGGVFQNRLLMLDIEQALTRAGIEVWINRAAPPNDGGVSLGQVALAAAARFGVD